MKITANGYVQTKVVPGTSYTGLVDADGSINVVVVAGSSPVGRYHPCGALNVVVVSGTTPVGRVHACGALNVVVGSLPNIGITHPSGALQVSNAVPTYVPSLDGIYADLTLNFSGSSKKAWVSNTEIDVASAVTVTRSTSPAYGRDAAGVYVSYAANTLRYDEVLGGALIEEGRTNLCLRSSELNNATWIKAADVTITADNDGGIFSGSTADMVTCSGAGGGQIYQIIGVTASTTYTWSFYAKLGTLAATDYKFALYDVTNAAFIVVNVVPSTLPNSSTWTRVTQTFTTPVGCTSIRAYPLRNGLAISGTAYIDHCQLELGSYATSPIPTTTAAVTRNADIINCTLPAALQNLTSYTMAWDGVYNANSTSNQFAVWLSDGTITNQSNLYKTGSNVAQLTKTPAGSATGLVTITPGTTLRLAGAVADSDMALLQTGQAARTATTAGFPTGLNRFAVGSYNGSAFALNGVCKSVSLWGSRRSNAAMATWVG